MAHDGDLQQRIGQRDDVINDATILATVQARVSELAPPESS